MSAGETLKLHSGKKGMKSFIDIKSKLDLLTFLIETAVHALIS